MSKIEEKSKMWSGFSKGAALGAVIVVAIGLSAGGNPAAADDGNTLGQEPYRPQLHFSPDQNWMNDPNGLVYDNGVYNLYFQYNPEGNEWGNMSWGHATSTDLMNWKMQPVAIPQGPNEYIYSGSAVVDTNNTSGFGTKADPPMVAIYTSQYHDDPVHGNNEAQSLAYSTDHGMTWTKYSGNPVLDLNRGDFRDPKVFWYGGKAHGYWVMVAVEANESTIVISRSDDLKHWTQESTFTSDSVPGFWECPDLFPLALDGDKNNVKWVMAMSAGASRQAYVVGDFDGKTFTEEKSDANAVATASVPKGTSLGAFDDGTFDGWTVTNDPTVGDNGPFGTAPAAGAVDGQQAVTGFAGAGLLNSFHGGDAGIGRATSPSFTIDSNYIDFLVGGGNHPREAGTGSGAAPDGDMIFDFERNGKTLADEGWTGTGDLNPSDQPAKPYAQPNVAQGFDGNGYLSTFYTPDGNDNATGTLTSPTFTITKKYIDLLLGGGQRDPSSGQTLEAQLVVDGKVVASSTGANTHLMNWKSWDASAYLGKQAQIRVVDTATGGWGAIWIDDVMQSDNPAIPRSDETTVDLVIDGQTVKSTTGPSDDGTLGPQAEFLNWASWDVSAYKGKSAQIQVIDNNTGGFGHIMADQFTAADAPAKPNPVPIPNQLDWGRDNYASNTYNNVPDGARISIGWMGQAFTSPTSPWRGNDTLPRELSLKTIDGRPQIVTQFIPQLANYEKTYASYTVPVGDIASGTTTLPAAADGDVQRIRAVLTPGTASDFGITVRGGDDGTGTKIGYDVTTQSLYIDRSHSGLIADNQMTTPNTAPLPLVNGKLTLDIVVDHGSVEVIGGDGRRIMSNMIYPPDSATSVSLYASGGSAHVDSMSVTPMYGSMWDTQPHLTVPQPPTGVTANPTKTGTATVSWAAPTDTGNTPITGYTVYAKKAAEPAKRKGVVACTTQGDLSCTATGLTSGTTYTFSVVATNVVGDSAASAPSAAVTVQAPPTITSASVGDGDVVSGKVRFKVKLAGPAAGISYTYIELNRGSSKVWVTDNTKSAGSTNQGLSPTLVVDTTALPDGAYGLKIDAVGKNGLTTEKNVAFTIRNVPRLSFVAPASSGTVSGTVTVKVKLESANPQAYNLRVDSSGLQYVYEPTAGVISFRLNTRTLTNGEHTLLATAVDKDGDKTTVTRTVDVEN